MVRIARVGSPLLLVALLAAPAWAQDAKEAGTVSVVPSTKPVGEYSGARPGEGPAVRSRGRRGKYPLVSWVGFQPGEGGAGARVFVQLDREASYHQEVAGGALHLVIDGARYANRNARRQLDTRFFQTSIAGITSQPARKRRGARRRPGVELVIKFKNAAEAKQATAALSQGKDGMHYLVLDL